MTSSHPLSHPLQCHWHHLLHFSYSPLFQFPNFHPVFSSPSYPFMHAHFPIPLPCLLIVCLEFPPLGPGRDYLFCNITHLHNTDTRHLAGRHQTQDSNVWFTTSQHRLPLFGDVTWQYIAPPPVSKHHAHLHLLPSPSVKREKLKMMVSVWSLIRSRFCINGNSLLYACSWLLIGTRIHPWFCGHW